MERNGVDYLGAHRVHPVIYILITNKLCTYRDLKYDLDIDDVLDLYEICMCNIHNRNAIMENIRESQGE